MLNPSKGSKDKTHEQLTASAELKHSGQNTALLRVGTGSSYEGLDTNNQVAIMQHALKNIQSAATLTDNEKHKVTSII